ncbi:MAG: OB-fold domain-containing protein [Deltaproteobacteria bacterium]|nr:OB-fold domain-containing protein [Deltaproteobacteria bacterium]
MDDDLKPLPVINDDNRDFWNGCRNHELRFQKCEQCGHVRWPASLICPVCFCRAFNWIVSEGRGRIYTFVVYHVAYHPGFQDDLPYVVAVVELTEGPRLLTNIAECPIDEISCDMPVEVTWRDVNKEISLPLFRPAVSV